MIKSFFRMFWFKYALSRYQWYRRWYGGRWEYHYIDVCKSSMWLDMTPPRIWPEWRQPCSFGTPKVEDWPLPGTTLNQA